MQRSQLIFFRMLLHNIALVAQLDRVLASEAKCRVFESPRAHHNLNPISIYDLP